MVCVHCLCVCVCLALSMYLRIVFVIDCVLLHGLCVLFLLFGLSLCVLITSVCFVCGLLYDVVRFGCLVCVCVCVRVCLCVVLGVFACCVCEVLCDVVWVVCWRVLWLCACVLR